MYPFASLREAWDELYANAARRVPEAPAALRWDLDAEDTWSHPQLELGMTCGWPLATELRDRVRTVGAFTFALEGAPTHLYRSVIVARRQADVSTFAGSTAAINGRHSLSGFISLLAAVGAPSMEWPGDVVWTRAHRRSIDAVRRGDAEIASIDAVTWAYLTRDEPDAVAGLVVVDRGPLVPTLPLIVNGATSDERVDRWRDALADAASETLLIKGFVALDLADYDTALSELLARVA